MCKMKYILRKVGRLFLIAAGCWLLLAGTGVQAAEGSQSINATTVKVVSTEVGVDQESGSFSFELQICNDEPYAGAEFGVFCSQGVEITSVSSSAGSVTGPKEANGLVWFGFFDGEDSFKGEISVTVEGSSPTGCDAAVLIQDVKIYSVGEQEYTSQFLECGTMINLRADLSAAEEGKDTIDSETSEESGSTAEMDKAVSPKTNDGINVIVWMICGLLIAAAAITLIYRKNHKK